MLTPPTLSRHWPDPKADGIGESTSMSSYVSHEISPFPVTMTPMVLSITLWLFNIAMDNGPFIDGLPIKNGGSFHGKRLVITRW